MPPTTNKELCIHGKLKMLLHAEATGNTTMARHVVRPRRFRCGWGSMCSAWITAYNSFFGPVNMLSVTQEEGLRLRGFMIGVMIGVERPPDVRHHDRPCPLSVTARKRQDEFLMLGM